MKSLLALLVFTNVAFAHTEFRGNLKGNSLPCSLIVQQVYYAGNVERPENLRLDVLATILGDDHHIAHGEEFFFTVMPVDRPNLLSGIGQNQRDQINVMTATNSLDSINAFAVKWWHVNHFHSAQCVNLRRVQ